MEKEDNPCPGCSSSITLPYIHCMECAPPLDICLHCFARGVEIGLHQSNHKYTVVKDDFPLFDDNWTAAEEAKLLNLLSEYGFGNWSDVANHMQTKSRTSCEAHYQRCYLTNPRPPLPEMPEADITVFPSPVPFRPCDDPPRPIEGSSLQQELSGYMPARGDFTVEYDNYAEMDLRDIAFNVNHDSLELDLKLAAIGVYQNVVLERMRRKRIIRHCGIINMKHNIVCNRRYEKSIGNDIMDTLRVFQRLVPPEDWDYFLEAWHYEEELKSAIKKLQEYRKSGLTRLSSTGIYDTLKARRDKNRHKQNLLTDVLACLDDKTGCHQWLKKQVTLTKVSKGEVLPVPNLARRSSVPLDIVTLPGYEKLSDREKEVCSQVRLIPEAYMEFKNLLITECRRTGYLRLAQARTMIKIDVNKTRKIYDFLTDEGLIYKEPIALG